MELQIPGGFDEYGFPYLELRVVNKKLGLSTKARAIIDTGAAHCLVRAEIAERLQLEELRTADYLHPVFGTMPVKEYRMDLCLGTGGQRGEYILEGVRAGTLVDPRYPAPVIIGVEVLRHWRISYDGPRQTLLVTVWGEGE